MKKGLAAEIEKIGLVDTHEHLRLPFPKNPGREIGLFELFANNVPFPFRTNYYLRADLISAGMNPEIWKGAPKSPRQSFRMTVPFLDHVRTSSYFLSFLLGLQEVYGFSGRLEKESEWLALDRRVRKAYRDDGWEMFVLKKKAGLEKMFYCYGWKPESDGFLQPVLRMDNYLNLCYQVWPWLTEQRWPRGWEGDHKFTLAELGIRINGFDDYLASFDPIFRRAKAKGTVAVKIASAYNRSLEYRPVSLAAAGKIFSRRNRRLTDGELRAFENALMPVLLKKCVDYDLPVQIHTGFLAGNATPTSLRGINPFLLQNVLFDNPEARFVLFHAGYPHLRETLTLVKKFPHVHLDICWLPLISFSAARAFLGEALETVPANKIMWGGDSHNVESILGAARFARRLVTGVLEEKIRRKEILPGRAAEIARGILRDNAIRLFRLAETGCRHI